MLSVHTIRDVEKFFTEKKNQTLNALGDECTSHVADFYVKGFLQMVIDKIYGVCPELNRSFIPMITPMSP